MQDILESVGLCLETAVFWSCTHALLHCNPRFIQIRSTIENKLSCVVGLRIHTSMLYFTH